MKEKMDGINLGFPERTKRSRERDLRVSEEIKVKCATGDRERDHRTADLILVALLRQMGFTKTVAAYKHVGKDYA